MEPVEMTRNETDDCYVFQHPDLFPKAFQIMDEMRSQGTFCDVVLKIEDKCFSAHKIVLASTIPYFQTMFAHGMDQTKQKVILHGIDTIAVEYLLNFAYSAKLILHDNTAQSIMLGASFLQLHEVVEACAKFLCEKLNPQNVLRIRQLADTLACESLLKAADEYTNQNFHDVSLSDEFLNLPLEDVLDIVQRDNLVVVSEDKVFEACLQWVKHCDDRIDCLPRLLAKVRLSLQNFNTVPRTEDYTAAVRNTPTAGPTAAARTLRQEEAQQQAAASAVGAAGTSEQRPAQLVRTPDARLPVIFAVGGSCRNDDFNIVPVNTVTYLDSTTLIWKEAPNMSQPRSNCKVVVYNDKLYAIGGYTHIDCLSTVEVFDPLKKQWKYVASMIDKRRNFGAAALDRFIYVCGGIVDGTGKFENTIVKYSPQCNFWVYGRPMIKKRANLAVVAYQGSVYALGGSYGRLVPNSVERYDPATNEWTEATPMLTPRLSFGVSELNGKLYACGGSYCCGQLLNSVEMFDPVLNKWQFVAPMHNKRSCFAVTDNMGKLWAVGGSKGIVEVYDPVSDTWNLVTSKSFPEYNFGVGLLPYD